jgi:hypothetical protein
MQGVVRGQAAVIQGEEARQASRLPVLEQRAASEGPRWTRAVGSQRTRFTWRSETGYGLLGDEMRASLEETLVLQKKRSLSLTSRDFMSYRKKRYNS